MNDKSYFLIALLSTFVFLQMSCGQDTPSAQFAKIVQADPELNSILPADTKIEKLIDGFGLLEGPAWGLGYLLFSDMERQVIYKWDPKSGLSLFLKTGFTGAGPNGLAFDQEGRLTICEHGNRRVSRLEKDGSLTVLAEYYRGKRLNSPNDLVYRSDGLLYFTDPPFGLPGSYTDPEKELAFSGIFLVSERKLELLTDELREPNGLALSPDEKYLYIGNDNQNKPVINRYEVKSNGTLSRGEVFFNAWSKTGAGSLDGMKADVQGNLYVSAAPTGLIIVNSRGKHLGTIHVPDIINIGWGGDDQKDLYITGAKTLYRIHLKIPGSRTFRGRSVHSSSMNLSRWLDALRGLAS